MSKRVETSPRDEAGKIFRCVEAGSLIRRDPNPRDPNLPSGSEGGGFARRRTRRDRRPSFRLPFLIAALICASACSAKRDARPLFLLETRGTPGPNFVRDVADLLRVDLQPSFVDVQAIRETGSPNGLMDALRVDCRNRSATGIVHIGSDVGSYVQDGAPGAALATATVVAGGCGGAETLPFVAMSSQSFHAQTHGEPTVSELRAAIVAADERTLRKLSSAIRNDPAKFENLRRYGLALNAREQTTLCQFTAGFTPAWAALGLSSFNQGWTVENLDPRGTAALAGVRSGDILTAVNDVVPNLFNLTTLSRKADASGRWEVVDVSRSGARKKPTYAARNARGTRRTEPWLEPSDFASVFVVLRPALFRISTSSTGRYGTSLDGFPLLHPRTQG